MARPTDYSSGLAAAICERLGEGEALKDICASDEMPSRSSIYLWLAQHKEFSDMYARAREEQADTVADEIVSLADDEGIPPDSRRIRVDARKWVASKLKPRKYGDKLDANVNVTVGWVGALMELGRKDAVPADG